MAHSSWLWLAPKPATGSAMVLSATLRTVLSSTIAIRLVIRTPRMIHRRRYTFGSVSASGATAEAPACGEAPGESMAPFPDPRLAGAVAPRPVVPGTVTARPGVPACRVPPAGLSRARGAWHPEDVRGRHQAPRGRRISMTAQPSDSGAAATKARTAEPLYGGSASRRLTVRDLAAAKARGEKWPMLTAYDALTARVFDDAGIPVLLVGDSAGMVVYGHDTTI